MLRQHTTTPPNIASAASPNALATIKAFDIYRNIHHDKHRGEATISGGLATVLALMISMYLFISETMLFLEVETLSRTYVDKEWDALKAFSSTMDVNIDITMCALPCQVASLDIADVMGEHVVDITDNIKKIRLDASGTEMRDTLLPVKPNEGCRISGRLSVKKVPGNVHISVHGHLGALEDLGLDELRLNLSHEIHTLYFGPELVELEKIDSDSSFSPLSGALRVFTDETLSKIGMSTNPSFEYYIKIVPTIVKRISGERIKTYQYTANSNMIQSGNIALFFRFDLTPITIEFVEVKKSFSHFLVQLCAIIGGVITILGLVSEAANRSLASIIEKARVGKLG